MTSGGDVPNKPDPDEPGEFEDLLLDLFMLDDLFEEWRKGLAKAVAIGERLEYGVGKNVVKKLWDGDRNEIDDLLGRKSSERKYHPRGLVVR